MDQTTLPRPDAASVQPALFELLARSWTPGAAVTSLCFDRAGATVAFALADGRIALRDANVVPLAQRQAVQGLVAQENGDRDALYREIARANGHPEWEADIRSTFAQRWIGRAQSGWYVQSGGQWSRK